MTKLRYSAFKDTIDLDQFEAAIEFTPLRQTGGNDIGHCVFPDNHSHGDTTGKFAIHRDKKVYNCFACGGGSLLSLAMELFDFTIEEATDWIYQFSQDTHTQSDSEYRDFLIGLMEEHDRQATLPYFNERVLERFQGTRDYFYERGISDTIIDSYRLCTGTVMKPAPIKKTDDGPVKIDEDYYGPAAIFPHYWEGKLVGWQHRWLEWGDDTPKWLGKWTNTTDFPKEDTLFNYDVARHCNEPIVVVESVGTVLFLASHGVPAVSYFGSRPTPQQLRLLREFYLGVILAPDNDNTGDKLLGATRYLERYVPVYWAEKVDLGENADLGDYVKTQQPYENLRDHLDHRVHLKKLKV